MEIKSRIGMLFWAFYAIVYDCYYKNKIKTLRCMSISVKATVCLIGSAMYCAAFNLVTRIGLPLFHLLFYLVAFDLYETLGK